MKSALYHMLSALLGGEDEVLEGCERHLSRGTRRSIKEVRTFECVS